ncbi:MAG: hypothetical protein VYC34_08245 [Planctomycetota bacterium]|nr:hypothetical protein [Planctomycetota bacterium]
MSISFVRLKQLADQEGLSFEELKARTGCCSGCGTCEPYVHRMLATGETKMPVMSPQESAEILRTAREWIASSKD